MSDATTVLREWAAAFRGDWGSVDGRGARIELNEIADWADSPDTAPSLLVMRETVGICRLGKGHWFTYCPDYNCYEEAKREETS